MVYLDYSATTPVNKDVLDSFNKVCLEYPGNANSLHKLGRESYHLMEAATKQVADLISQIFALLSLEPVKQYSPSGENAAVQILSK